MVRDLLDGEDQLAVVPVAEELLAEERVQRLLLRARLLFSAGKLAAESREEPARDPEVAFFRSRAVRDGGKEVLRLAPVGCRTLDGSGLEHTRLNSSASTHRGTRQAKSARGSVERCLVSGGFSARSPQHTECARSGQEVEYAQRGER